MSPYEENTVEDSTYPRLQSGLEEGRGRDVPNVITVTHQVCHRLLQPHMLRHLLS